MMDDRIFTRVPAELGEAVRAIAAARYADISTVVREALLEYVRTHRPDLLPASHQANADALPTRSPQTVSQ